jgi:hypothetical protein
MNEETLNKVHTIIDSLQRGKWEEHGDQLLISSQGKLASLMANVGAMTATAEYEYNVRKINHEQYEKEQYFVYRKEGMSAKDSEGNAKIDAFAKERTVFEARHNWQTLKTLLKAMEAMSVACSTTLKHQQKERMQSNNQGN